MRPCLCGLWGVGQNCRSTGWSHIPPNWLEARFRRRWLERCVRPEGPKLRNSDLGGAGAVMAEANMKAGICEGFLGRMGGQSWLLPQS